MHKVSIFLQVLSKFHKFLYKVYSDIQVSITQGLGSVTFFSAGLDHLDIDPPENAI